MTGRAAAWPGDVVSFGPFELRMSERLLARNGAPVSLGGRALDILVTATVRAMGRVPRAQLAHLFSLLPGIGLHESALSDDHLDAIASAAVRTGTTVEVNERWRCPGPRFVLAFACAGVTMVGATDSSEASTVGRYSWVAEAAAARSLLDAR